MKILGEMNVTLEIKEGMREDKEISIDIKEEAQAKIVLIHITNNKGLMIIKGIGTKEVDHVTEKEADQEIDEIGHVKEEGADQEKREVDQEKEEEADPMKDHILDVEVLQEISTIAQEEEIAEKEIIIDMIVIPVH